MKAPQSEIVRTEPDIVPPTFTDWAGFVTIQPELYFRPQDLEDLKGVLAAMQQSPHPRHFRVLGGLHSCSDICVSDAVIDVSDLPKTIEFSDDESSVTVSANWHLHDFLAELSRHGKSLSSTGGTDKQTLAGLISTNTAPATPRFTLYGQLEWVEYLTLDADGRSIVEKHVSRDEPAFKAAVASLGAIGILTRVCFKLVNEPYFFTLQKIIKLKEVLTDLEATSREYDFWRIDWIPDTENGLLWAAQRIPTADPQGDYPLDQSETILEVIFKLLDRLEGAGPLLDNAMRLVYSGLELTYGEVTASGPLRNMLPVDRRAPLQVAMAEWSFDPHDLPRLQESCRSYYKLSGWPNLPIEIELTKTDGYYMSAWNWPGLDYIVKFNFMYLTDISKTEAERQEIIDHLHGLWKHLLKDGIPFKAHWGKINFMDYDFVRSHYDLAAFQPFIRKQFLNPYLVERILPKS
jgi:hypothetical protein